MNKVFHICESGKKISFLCPNGTIFQQSDLICDWWFKVNCAASPGHYAESSESLLRARHRYHSNPPIIFTALHHGKSREPYELQEESLENYDFEDIAAPNTKSIKSTGNNRNPKDTSKSTIDLESQVFAESSAFAKPLSNSFTGSGYDQSRPKYDHNLTTIALGNSSANLNHQYQEGYGFGSTTARPNIVTTVNPTTNNRRGSTTYQQSRYETNSRQQRKQSTSNQFITYTTPNSIGIADTKSTATPRRRPSSYTTARKIESSRTTPFYTPTVPSIIVKPSQAFTYSTPDVTNQQNLQSTESTQSVSEHAVEMIKTLRDLNLNTVVLPQVDPSENKEFISGQRPGLVIPPSSGPDTLHSLALYFATAVDNLVTKPETTTAFEKSLYIQPGNVTKLSTSLVSNSTVEKYKQLFSIDRELPTKDLRSLTKPEDTSETFDDNDLDTQHSSNPVLAAAGTPHIRELAQVFTHALSAYLHDPNTFRRVLSEIRPTEPPTSNDIADPKLGTRYGRTDDFNKGTGPTYLPTQYTQTYGTTSPSVIPQSTTEELEVLDFSDVTVSTSKRDNFFTTTTTPSTTTTEIPEWLTTTEYSLTTVPLKPVGSLKQTLKQADRVPASRYLTEGLENTAIEFELAKGIRPATETNNPVAMEINGGLDVSTSIPYFHDDSLEHLNHNISLEDSNYFPINSIDQQSNYSASPYGEGVKPFNSTPIHDIYPTANENILPLSWNDGFSEKSYVATTTEYPSILSFELLPPASINDKGFVLPTNEILPPNIDENDLQRAQSQSIVSSNANLIARQQKSNLFSNPIELSTTSTTVRPSTMDYTTTSEDYNTVTDTINGHFITHAYATSTEIPRRRSTIPDTGKFSPNPWSTLAYTVFLDPLTINDGLMGSKNNLKTVTPSPNTYLPRSTQTYGDVTRTSTEPTPVRYSLRSSLTDTTASSDRKAKTLEPHANEYMDVMQKKATAMFGGLNDTSAHHLLNVMKKANKNKTVRKLILLLIQTCDNDDDASIEESRTSLLNALIGMDGRIDDDNELQVVQSSRHHNRRGGKSIGRKDIYAPTTTVASSTEIPITTYRRPVPSYAASASSDQFVAINPSNYDVHSTENYPDNQMSTIYSTPSDLSISTSELYTESTTTFAAEQQTTTEYTTTTTTEVPTTITTTTSTTTAAAVPLINNNRQRSPQSRRVVKDLDDLLGQHSHAYDSNTQSRSHKHSDTRALDLLKSLYSLAGKFGKR